MRRDVIIAENFYEDPLGVREYALSQLEQDSYMPYDSFQLWRATRFKEWSTCPFKSSATLMQALEHLTGETIDKDHWKKTYQDGYAYVEDKEGGEFSACKWNCAFHFRPKIDSQFGDGVHDHVTGVWNSVGKEGWVGLIYLHPLAPVDSGLFFWERKMGKQVFNWRTAKDNWKLLDSVGAVFNRLILHRGDIVHSGADGFSNDLSQGRLYQTFFFRTLSASKTDGVRVDF